MRSHKIIFFLLSRIFLQNLRYQLVVQVTAAVILMA